jgi:hypothetical protein
MQKILMAIALACAAGSASAQIKCWNDANGKRVCGDTPPPGARTTTLRNPAAGEPAPAAASKDAKDAKKGPLTPAEQEQAFRKRQADEQKAVAKAEDERKDADAKRQNCDNAKEAVAVLQTGGRIPRTDSKGERYFLDEKQIAQELVKARENVKQWCN